MTADTTTGRPPSDPDPVEIAAAGLLAGRSAGPQACGPTGDCGDCTSGCRDSDGAVCANDGGSASAQDRATVAASGVAITLVAALLVATGGDLVHLVLAGLAAAGGLALAGLGAVALRRGGHTGDRLHRLGTRVLPYVTAALLAGIVVRAVTFALGLR